MMKHFFLAISLLACFCAFSQSRRTAAFLEMGGPANLSLNWDTRFSKKANGLGLRTGAGMILAKENSQHTSNFSVPLEINYISKIQDYLFLELGAGLLYQNISYNNKNSPVDSGASHLSEYLDFAVRYYLPGQRFFFRAAYTPVFNAPNSIPFSLLAFGRHSRAGLSLGLDLGRPRS